MAAKLGQLTVSETKNMAENFSNFLILILLVFGCILALSAVKSLISTVTEKSAERFSTE